jgi:hypothetical protein
MSQSHVAGASRNQLTVERAWGCGRNAFLAAKSVIPRGSRTNKPSTVARLNSVSVIASGIGKISLQQCDERLQIGRA